MKETKLLIFGPPGCGKGTLSGFITKKAQLAHISVGEMIREHIAIHDEIGKQAEELVNHGKLISDDITNHMVKERLEKDDANNFLLDGYPRDVEQAEFLTKLTNITGVVLMTLEDSLIIGRLLKRGRADDTTETITDRIKLYHETTEPVLEFLKSKNIPIHEINGDYNLETDVDGIVQGIVDWQASMN